MFSILKPGRFRLLGPSLVFGFAAMAISASPAAAQDAPFAKCKGLVFSTEEDFLSRGPEPADGNPLVSDGDLLAYDAASGSSFVCARNRDLVGQFDVREDMGLDAVDVIDAEKGIVAFSTELDSPHGNFGQGDLLFPDGTVIPNAVFAFPFKLRPNVGLDAVHFVGDKQRIIKAIDLARQLGPKPLADDPATYIGRLKELGVDIWYSIEGTGPTPKAPGVLDGDILSLTGAKVVPQNALLDPPIPAGIPSRGVDFGADALTADRMGNRKSILFSTEILYRGEPRPFTDGDVLRLGGNVAILNEVLIKPLEPAADFIGLDALAFDRTTVTFLPKLDNLCGNLFVPRSPRDFDASGLWRDGFGITPPGAEPRRPCGLFVPVDGELTPAMDVKRFRIAYRKAGDPVPPVGTAPGIRTEWKIKTRNPVTLLCSSAAADIVPLANDGSVQQWMDAKDYLDARNGAPGGISDGCPNSGLQLAVWNTLGLPVADQDAHFIVWLEWETTGGAMMRDPFDYHVQLDNKAPTGTPGVNDLPKLEVRLADGSGKPVPACGEAPSGQSKFEVWGQFDDPHYWYFTVTVEGGSPPVSHTYARVPGDNTHEYYEVPDGPPGLKNTDATGTTPDGLLVHLRDIDMTELGVSFQKCCYLLRLWVHDATIRHSFNGFAAHLTIEHRRSVITTFAAG